MATSQIRTEPPSSPLTSQLPSGATATAYTQPVTRRYRYGERLLDRRLGVILGSYTGQLYCGALGREDSDRMVLGVQAMLGAELPTDEDGMAEGWRIRRSRGCCAWASRSAARRR